MENYIPPLQINTGNIKPSSQDPNKAPKNALQKQIDRLTQIEKENKKEDERLKEKLKQMAEDAGNSIYNTIKEGLGWDGYNIGNNSIPSLTNGANSSKFTQSSFSGGRLNTSFSGVDTKLSITFDGGKPVYIGEVQTVTYSLFRPIEPVYSLGDAKPTGFVRGQRTIAGSIIFTVFDRNVLLNAFYNAYAGYENRECVDQDYLTDELPPFDMHISFMNEYGISAALVIYGCYIPTEGQVHSIEDMITENTVQYVAQDMRLMRPGDIT